MSDCLFYLAYGSNLHPIRLKERIPSADFLQSVVLDGWQLKFHKRGQDSSGKCNLTHTGDEYDKVYGAVYSFSACEKKDLDVFEGVGMGYNTENLTVETLKGPLQVFCYLADPEYIDDSLKAFTWYQQLVYLGCQFHGFPVEYQAHVLSAKSEMDPDPLRNEKHEKLVDRIKKQIPV